MPPLRFKIKSVPLYTDNYAQLLSVLVPISGKPLPLTDVLATRRRVVRRTSAVLKRWRSVLRGIRSAGFASNPVFTARGTFAHYYNCHPAFVRLEELGLFCQLSWLCPWCYARYAGEVYKSIDACVFPKAPPPAPSTLGATINGTRALSLGEGRRRKTRRAALELIWRRVEISLPRDATYTAMNGGDVSLLRSYLEHRVKPRPSGHTARRLEWRRMQKLGVIGGHELIAVIPDPENPDCWRVITTQIILVPLGESERIKQTLGKSRKKKSAIYIATTEVKAMRDMRRFVFMRGIAEAMRYNVELLDALPSELAATGEARQGLRLAARFGVLRGQAQADDSDSL